MNLTDYRTTSMADVYRAVDAEARRAGAAIADSEIIGLVPRAALDDLAVVARRAHRGRVDRREPRSLGPDVGLAAPWRLPSSRLGPRDLGPMRVADAASAPWRLSAQCVAPERGVARRALPSAAVRGQPSARRHLSAARSSAGLSPPRRAGAMPKARILRYRLLRSTPSTSAVREMLPCCAASVRRM